MITDINLYKIIIGAYLHDMGKLLWRGGYSRGGQGYKIAHVQYLVDFFHNKGQFCYPGQVSETRKEIARIASYHHAKDYFDNHGWMKTALSDRPQATQLQQQLAWIIYMGDNLGSQERQNRIDNQEGEREYIKHVGLTSVFENIFVEQTTDPHHPQRKYSKIYTPRKLGEDIEFVDKGYGFDQEEQFMKDKLQGIGNTQVSECFKNLAEGFVKDLKNLVDQYVDMDDDELVQVGTRLISQLDILTQQYFSFVPSDAYKSIGDISLYDHTKIVVANSVLLYNMFFIEQQQFSLKETTDEINNKTIILIAGDFPSIQSYIHQSMNVNTGLAKRLRARSLIIQLLNEAVIQYILDTLRLPRANVLLNAGGKFVIAGNICHQKMMTEISNKINNYLIKHYGSSIKMNLIAKTFEINDIFNLDGGNNIGQSISDLFESLTQHKYQIYSKGNLELLFEKPQFNGINMRYGDSEGVTKETIIQEKILGQEIVKNIGNSIFINYHNDDDFDFMFVEITDRSSGKEQGVLLSQGQLQIRINNRDIDQNLTKEQLLSLGTRHCISKSLNRYVPKTMDNDIKGFDDIIREDKNGQNYLTIIKGDVDAMSLILKHGFGSIYSISRLLQFSRYLELFFGAKTERWLENSNIYNNVYTIFSGGDDFVFIVPFQQRIKFIQQYIKEFRDFVANNDYIHFSVGMYVFKNKTPLRYVDTECEKILKAAKSKAKKGFSEIKNLQDMSTELGMYGIGLYEKDFVIDLNTEFKGDDDIALALDRNIGSNPGQLSDTGLYTIYLQLQLMKKSLQQEQYAEYVTQLSKIYYMISKNLDGNERTEIVKNLGEMDISVGKDKLLGSLDALLLKIIHRVYSERGEKK